MGCLQVCYLFPNVGEFSGHASVYSSRGSFVVGERGRVTPASRAQVSLQPRFQCVERSTRTQRPRRVQAQEGLCSGRQGGHIRVLGTDPPPASLPRRVKSQPHPPKKSLLTHLPPSFGKTSLKKSRQLPFPGRGCPGPCPCPLAAPLTPKPGSRGRH